MTIEATAEGLEKTEWWEYLIRFVFGGLITALAGLIAHRFGPLVGGLFLAFPSIAPATATLIDRHDGRDAAVDSSFGAGAGAAGLVVFGAMVALLAPRLHIAIVLAVASAAWLAVSAAVWWLATTLHPRRSDRIEAGVDA